MFFVAFVHPSFKFQVVVSADYLKIELILLDISQTTLRSSKAFDLLDWLFKSHPSIF